MQAILTKYIGPGNVRGSRIKVTAQAGTIYVAWDDAKGHHDNHDAAAKVFIRKMGWFGSWYVGSLPDGSGVYVWANRSDTKLNIKPPKK